MRIPVIVEIIHVSPRLPIQHKSFYNYFCNFLWFPVSSINIAVKGKKSIYCGLIELY